MIGKVEHRPERTDHEIGRLLERELAHVLVAQLEADTGVGRPLARDREHLRRDVGPDHAASGALDDRDRDPSRSHGQLDHGPARFLGELDVERDVLGHGRRERVVDGSEGVVVAHAVDSSSLLQLVTC